jgi:transposase
MAKYRVTLTQEERDELQSIVKTGKAAARKINHARILLLSDVGEFGPGRTDGSIVEALGTSLRTVERVRKRFVEEGLDQAVNPRPQPKRPSKVKIQGKVEEQLVELACSDPPAGRGRWTLQLLADQLVILSCVDSVSHESVRKSLKKTTSTWQP